MGEVAEVVGGVVGGGREGEMGRGGSFSFFSSSSFHFWRAFEISENVRDPISISLFFVFGCRLVERKLEC